MSVHTEHNKTYISRPISGGGGISGFAGNHPVWTMIHNMIYVWAGDIATVHQSSSLCDISTHLSGTTSRILKTEEF